MPGQHGTSSRDNDLPQAGIVLLQQLTALNETLDSINESLQRLSEGVELLGDGFMVQIGIQAESRGQKVPDFINDQLENLFYKVGDMLGLRVPRRR